MEKKVSMTISLNENEVKDLANFSVALRDLFVEFRRYKKSLESSVVPLNSDEKLFQLLLNADYCDLDSVFNFLHMFHVLK